MGNDVVFDASSVVVAVPSFAQPPKMPASGDMLIFAAAKGKKSLDGTMLADATDDSGGAVSSETTSTSHQGDDRAGQSQLIWSKSWLSSPSAVLSHGEQKGMTTLTTSGFLAGHKNDDTSDNQVPALPSRPRKQQQRSYCGLEETPKSPTFREEQAWAERQRLTGAACRLVEYKPGDDPRIDLQLRGGGPHRIVVAACAKFGTAAQVGVVVGDVLVSIDGAKDFQGRTAEEVHARLCAPVTLVFMGFVGKLEAEVRLEARRPSCCLSSQHRIIDGGSTGAPVRVVDAVVFQPSKAALLLATTSSVPRGDAQASEACRSFFEPAVGDDGAALEEEEDSEGEVIDIDIDLPDNFMREEGAQQTSSNSLRVPSVRAARDESQPAAVYELHGHEARNLVEQALSRTPATHHLVREVQRSRRSAALRGDHPRIVADREEHEGCAPNTWFGNCH